MSLTTEELGLLRSLVEWRRANGWTYKAAWDKVVCDRDGAPMSEPCMRHTWESPSLPNGERSYVEALVVSGELWAVNYCKDYGDELAHIKGGRGFLDLAHALLAAGQESAYDRDEWRVMAPDRAWPRSWAPITDAVQALAELAEARRNGIHDAYLQHRRMGATEWVRVPEAGGTDA
jgi:hypothetical protein